MDPQASRPVTSKPRGVCRYYNTSRGCFAGDKCRFLHGESETITPFDRSKTCAYYAAGYCRKGDKCWFRHVKPETSKSPSLTESGVPADGPSEDSNFEDQCCICYEKPTTYGLLVGCSHVFCNKCIREWRDAATKSSDVVSSGAIKKCPYCRVEVRFITPSSIFYPEGHPGKDRTILKYKESMAKVPCRYFQKSDPVDRFCPFGRDCFYRHQNKDGTPYIFEQGVDYCLPQYKRRVRRETVNRLTWMRPGDAWEDISATIEAIRNSIPELLRRPGDGENGEGQREGVETISVETLERLASRVLVSLNAMESSGQFEYGNPDRDEEQEQFVFGNQDNDEEQGEWHGTDNPLQSAFDFGSSDPSNPHAGSSSAESHTTASSSSDEIPSGAPYMRFSTTVSPSRLIDLDEYVFGDDGSENESDGDGDDNEFTFQGGSELVDYADLFEDSNMQDALMRLVADWGPRLGETRDEGESIPEEVLEEEVRTGVEEPMMVQGEASPGLPDSAVEQTQETGPSPEQVLVNDFESLGRPEIQFNTEPPFVSDGRGRVVWSNTTRGRSVRERGK